MCGGVWGGHQGGMGKPPKILGQKAKGNYKGDYKESPIICCYFFSKGVRGIPQTGGRDNSQTGARVNSRSGAGEENGKLSMILIAM